MNARRYVVERGGAAWATTLSGYIWKKGVLGIVSPNFDLNLFYIIDHSYPDIFYY